MLISSRQSYTVSIHIIIPLFNYLCHIFRKGFMTCFSFCFANVIHIFISHNKNAIFFLFIFFVAFCCIKTPGSLRTLLYLNVCTLVLLHCERNDFTFPLQINTSFNKKISDVQMDHAPYCIFPEFVNRDHIFRMLITDRQSNIPPIIRSRLPMVA